MKVKEIKKTWALLYTHIATAECVANSGFKGDSPWIWLLASYIHKKRTHIATHSHTMLKEDGIIIIIILSNGTGFLIQY